MTPERYKEVSRLYCAALELAPTRWADYLADACGGDEALRQEAESLLAYEARGERLIDQPALEAAAKAMAEDEAVSAVPSLIGQSVGHCRILSLLGKGGMGEVWLAEDIHLGRKVAVKLLPAEFTADADRVRRFAQEARAASALNHPNIITIHEIGEVGKTHYLITEYVEGETLRQQMAHAPDNRIKLAEAIELAAQVAAALVAAHEASITHRDIKPENVMVRNDGIVKVLDFGLAKLVETRHAERRTRHEEDEEMLVQDDLNIHRSAFSDQHSTVPGAVMGTPRYMSPEQARGEQVDTRTDIFSLGVMLYEMVAGRTPFAGATTSEVIAALLRDSPPPLTEYAPDVPPEMGRILSRSLHKDRDERYQTVKELLVDLKDLTAARAFEARLERSAPLVSAHRTAPAATRAASFIRWIKMHPRSLTIALLVLLVAIIAIARFSSGSGKKAIDSLAMNSEANRLYMLGRDFWNKFGPENNRKAIENFNLAIAQDPNYALAYTGLAKAYGTLGVNGGLPPKEALPKAKAAALKALEIDEQLAEAHAVLAGVEMFYEWNWSAAERELQRALAINANDPLTHVEYSYLFTALGRFDEAIAHVKINQQLDPISIPMYANLVRAYYFARRYDEALETNRRRLEMDLRFPILAVGTAYEQKGRYEEAILELQNANRLLGGFPEALGALGHVYATSGKRDEAMKTLEELKAMSKQKYVSPLDLAILYIGLGDKGQALDQLGKAYEDRAGWLINLKVEPRFDSLRSEPRFADLLRRIGLST